MDVFPIRELWVDRGIPAAAPGRPGSAQKCPRLAGARWRPQQRGHETDANPNGNFAEPAERDEARTPSSMGYQDHDGRGDAPVAEGPAVDVRHAAECPEPQHGEAEAPGVGAEEMIRGRREGGPEPRADAALD